MTATPDEDARAGAAQSAGEAAESKHLADALAVHQASGSAVTVEDARTGDDTAVAWQATDSSASPSLSPSQPPPTNSAERSPSDLT